MKKVSIEDLKAYNPPKHFEMRALKVHEKEAGPEPKYWMGMSHFLPGGGAEYGVVPMELVYFVLDGEITVKTKDETFKLKKWESIHIMPGESREVINETNLPATMLVIM
ncbi:cupin domain-containing protein [Clostridium sp. SYSU_GA19001]|uniref:cupin domain-containing protein n=1 Tax=Clostridium caldaquaticum TaxID=2940653 RepID=UPI0020773033|nr:cupin domain-containing protein [Clostridium caldaquaticum]MCM8711241.1 cupin domain-containing protein [Clostridium caldaquaticum]